MLIYKLCPCISFLSLYFSTHMRSRRGQLYSKACHHRLIWWLGEWAAKWDKKFCHNPCCCLSSWRLWALQSARLEISFASCHPLHAIMPGLPQAAAPRLTRPDLGQTAASPSAPQYLYTDQPGSFPNKQGKAKAAGGRVYSWCCVVGGTH